MPGLFDIELIKTQFALAFARKSSVWRAVHYRRRVSEAIGLPINGLACHLYRESPMHKTIGLEVLLAPLLVVAAGILFFHFYDLVALFSVSSSGSDPLSLKVFSAFVLVGAGWTIYNFVVSETTSWLCNISLATEIVPYRDDLRLLVIHVRATNPQKSMFRFDEPNPTYKLNIRLLDTNAEAKTVFKEDDGEAIASLDLLKGSGGYEMLPDAVMDDMRTIVLPVGKIVSMTAELRIKRWMGKDSDFISASSVIKNAA